MDIDKLLITWAGDNKYSTTPSILTTNAKVLCLIAVDPEITQIAMAVTLRVSETAIEKAVANLVNAGIVSVERVGRRNRYILDGERFANHGEIYALKEIIDDVQARLKDS